MSRKPLKKFDKEIVKLRESLIKKTVGCRTMSYILYKLKEIVKLRGSLIKKTVGCLYNGI